MPDVLDHLLAKPGLYVGSQSDPTGEHPGGGASRIAVSPLAGGTGVLLEYEVLQPQGGRVHWEHTMLVRTSTGLATLTAHTHGDVATFAPETEPGTFPAPKDTSPFPMQIKLEVPEPGHLIYTWSYGRPGDEAVPRDIGDLRVVDQ